MINGRHKKLVSAEKTISQGNPTAGNKNAPERLLVISAKLLKLHKSAKDVASNPGIVFLAIKSIIIKKINIPTKL